MQAETTTSVLVLWATPSSPNLGVRVLADGMAALARSAFGRDTRVEFQDVYPSEHGPGFGGRTLARDVLRPRGPIKERLRGFDVVLDSGAGDSFADIYGLKRLVTFAYVQRASQHLDQPTHLALGPQTIGPFNTHIGRRIARSSLKNAALVIVRDPSSAEHLTALGRIADCEATDVVFQLPAPTRSKALDVVVNVSGLLWQPNRHVDAGAYQAGILALCRRFVDEGRSVTLLPHVLDNPSRDNDLPATEAVRERLGESVSVHVPAGLDDARAVLSSARLVIGSRMHACLNALSVGTPAISWAYSRKFEPLMTSIGWPFNVDLRTESDPVGRTFQLLGQTTESEMEAMVGRAVDQAHGRLEPASRALAALRAEPQ